MKVTQPMHESLDTQCSALCWDNGLTGLRASTDYWLCAGQTDLTWPRQCPWLHKIEMPIYGNIIVNLSLTHDSRNSVQYPDFLRSYKSRLLCFPAIIPTEEKHSARSKLTTNINQDVWRRRCCSGCWQWLRHVQGWICWRWRSQSCLPLHCWSP